MIFKSLFPDIVLPKTGIVQYIFSNPYGASESKPILIDGLTNETITLGELRSLVNRFAACLQDQFGFKRGEVVAVYSCNQIDYSVPLFGTLAAGGIVSPVNPAYNEKELVFQLKEAHATVLITHPSGIDVAIKAAKAVGIPKERVLLFGGKAVDGLKPYKSILGKREAKPVEYSFEEAKTTTAFLCFSSGTTGQSKGVETTHLNMTSNIAQQDLFEKAVNRGNETYLGVLPFYHIYGLNVLIHLHLYLYRPIFILHYLWSHRSILSLSSFILTTFQGCPLVVMQKFNFVDFCDVLQRHKVTIAHIVPPIAILLTKSPVVKNYDLSSIKLFWSGAAPLSAELSQDLTTRLGSRIKQGYGMTESSPVSHIVPTENIIEGSVGLLMPSMEAKIVDKDGKELGYGQAGELWLRGPNVMKGYLNNPKATRETLDAEGFLHTGDVAYVDRNGFFYIVDRLKELIKYKGFQIPPAELEALLLTSPLVVDAAVIGVNDPSQATELPRAYIVLAQGVPATPETAKSIEKFVEERVGQHKKLRGGVKFLAVIPKSSSGKILRRYLRVEAEAETKNGKAKL
ncbi:hypothetical protein BC936DRAFT_144630 [Jimgerdemannia flammicorona]|uniref:Acetyl-CoA synthetase-like protein n=1 Tax=Jimgerdemannia flammicorona TaxID=994334 RepID=A0A433DNE1_9FUNG|nr:hypothetical protein BC936DRAFT_144630 [Jimgerdemannia flammicorona]